MNNFQKKYYNQTDIWNRNFSEILGEDERANRVINTIPSDVETILDVGCGNGFFLNKIAKEKKYKKLVGVDKSEEALKYVKTKKILGDISNLPFKEKSFDLVTCLEVLEHLPQESFDKEILEIQRISKKYILITVPNNQNLEYSLVRCPKCCCWFNPNFHLRSFDEKKLEYLFDDLKLTRIKAIGPLIKIYPLFLLSLYRTWKKPLPPPTAVCPQCGYQDKQREQNKIKPNKVKNIFLLFKFLAKLIWRPKEKSPWLLALYSKNGR